MHCMINAHDTYLFDIPEFAREAHRQGIVIREKIWDSFSNLNYRRRDATRPLLRLKYRCLDTADQS